MKRTSNKDKSKVNKVIYIVSKFIFGALFLLSLTVTIYISSIPYNDTLRNINEIFSGRLRQVIQFYNEYGIHLIGSPIYTVGIKNAFTSGKVWVGLDAAYLNYTLKYGLIFMLFLSVCYYRTCKKLRINKLIYESAYIIIICIMGITENILLLPYYNFALFLIAKNFKSGNEGDM